MHPLHPLLVFSHIVVVDNQTSFALATMFVSILISQLEKEHVNTHNHDNVANVDWFSNILQILLGNFQLQILLINTWTISSEIKNQYERHQTPATAKTIVLRRTTSSQIPKFLLS